MAEEPQTAAPTQAVAETVVVTADLSVEKVEQKEKAPAAPEPEEAKPAAEAAGEADEKKPAAEEVISESVSFKEESNRVSDLPDPEKKALEELKQLIQEALNKREFTAPPPKDEENPKEEEKPKEAEKPKEEEKLKEEETPKEVEESKTEEEASKPAEAAEEPKAEAEEPPKTEVLAAEPAPVAEVLEETVVVASVVVDDDGAKTVEAIEETVVAVAAPPAPAPESSEPPAEKIEEATAEEAPAAPEVLPEEVFIWGVPLIGDEKSDVILLKFLRARDFKVKDAFTMIKNTVRWRKEFGIDSLLEEDLGNDLASVVFMHGYDKEGHPVCYNVYGEFQSKELYDKTFSDAEKRQKFLRWRIQFLEKSISQQLDFSPSGICTFVQVTDLKNSPGPGKRELRQATNQALNMLQDNYPEFVAKQVFINVPWWYLAFNRMISPFLTQRTKSKFVFAGPSKSTDTLFRYIAPEQVPVQYGGLSKESDPDFSTADPVTEITIKPASKYTVELPATEASVVVWELRVVGWDVSYGAEFIPSAEDGYTVIVQKTRKISPTDEPVIKNSFKIGEPGKVFLTVNNTSSKKKKLLYRSKTKTSSDSI
ncbi:patellin-3-like [Aristolochia californica]|uniref:patellin-3-like n=1 Tax=Aristolochia californica TaxID=171875 RepID=UPI0035D76B3C